MMSSVCNLPVEVGNLILDYVINNDNDSVLIARTCKALRWIIRQRDKTRPLYFRLQLRRFVQSVPLTAWALQNGCPGLNPRTLSQAVRYGNLEVVQWLRLNKKCPWDSWVFTHACEGGNLEIIKWLKEHGCPWDSWTSSNTCWSGQFAVLRWLKSEGCPWNNSLIRQHAEFRRRTDILEWLDKV